MVTRSKKMSKNTKTMKTFSGSDFLSRDGMLTRVWGPSIWHYLHTMSFNYPINPTVADKKHYRSFILNLKNVIPCGKCRSNLVENFKKLPLKMSDMKSRTTFSRYIYELHELINRMLGKISGLTYKMVRERYEHFRARCTVDELQKPIQPFRYKQVNTVRCTSRHCTGTRKKKRENGCTDPLYGKKSKCIIKIVPDNERVKTFHIDKSCERSRD